MPCRLAPSQGVKPRRGGLGSLRPRPEARANFQLPTSKDLGSCARTCPLPGQVLLGAVPEELVPHDQPEQPQHPEDDKPAEDEGQRSHGLILAEPPTGVEPAPPAYRAGTLPSELQGHDPFGGRPFGGDQPTCTSQRPHPESNRAAELRTLSGSSAAEGRSHQHVSL